MWRPAKPLTLIRRFWQSGDRENLFGAVWRSVAESGDRENLLSLKRPFRESGDRANLLGLATFHWETVTTFSPARGGPIQVLGERGNLLSLKFPFFHWETGETFCFFRSHWETGETFFPRHPTKEKPGGGRGGPPYSPLHWASSGN